MNSSKNYQKMSEEQKAFYKDQLQKNPGENYKSEYVRKTDLERKLIDEYGFEGIKLVFESKNSANYFQLGEFPPDCPWANLNNKNLLECIKTDFALIGHKIPNLLKAMQERCRFIYAEKVKSVWRLHYLLETTLYDGRPYFIVYTGGSPNPTPTPNENLIKFGWTIPRDLAEFYSIHDGFGEISNDNYVQSSAEIRVMGEMMNRLCAEEKFSPPEEYNFDDLLEFFPDGAGNGQCFHRKNGDSDNALTVDWDHEVWEISEEQGFYEFIDERMSLLDEE